MREQLLLNMDELEVMADALEMYISVKEKHGIMGGVKTASELFQAVEMHRDILKENENITYSIDQTDEVA